MSPPIAIRATVFTYHDVVAGRAELAEVPAAHRPYVLTRADLRAQLLAAARSGRRCLTIGSLAALDGGFFALTFDDGHLSNYTEAFPALLEAGLRATFFLVPPLLGKPGYIGWGEAREMVARGMEVGSHSLTHPFVDRLGREELRREFGDSRRMLEDRLGAAVVAGSLPHGWGSPLVREVVRELGYHVFCTSRPGWWLPGGDRLAVPRIAVRDGMSTDHFIALLAGHAPALWRVQGPELLKGAVKACLGRRGWNLLRRPLLGLRYGGGCS